MTAGIPKKNFRWWNSGTPTAINCGVKVVADGMWQLMQGLSLSNLTSSPWDATSRTVKLSQPREFHRLIGGFNYLGSCLGECVTN